MREDIIGPKYAIRLGDLKPWHILQVTCFHYRYVATLSPAPLFRRFGEHAFLSKLEDRFRCTECDHRGGNSAKVYRLDRNDR